MPQIANPPKPDADPDSYEFAPVELFLAENLAGAEKVRFTGDKGTGIVGNLYRPDLAGAAPAIVLIGPETYVKEQVPAAYARRFAEQGFVALAFDPRHRGESGGMPRDLEDPKAKVADIRAAVDFLTSLESVDPRRIYGVAICQGSSEMVRAAADDDRIKALATLAGHYRDRQGDIEWFQGEDKLCARIENAKRAARKFKDTGEVDYVPAVDKADPTAGMPGELVWSWYHRWADEALPWENRFAVMSDVDLLAYESMSASERLQQPYIMFHSDQCMLPDAAKRHFEKVPSPKKQMVWWGDLAHFQFYDDPRVIDPAVAAIAAFFDRADAS